MGLEEGAGDEAVVNVGSDVTSIVVHSKGAPRFVRMLPSGGREINEAIARALPVSAEEAEQLKRGEAVGSDDVRTQAEAIVRTRMGAFIDEVRSSLDFYTAQSPGSRIERVVITGGGSVLPGLLELLQERVPATIERGHVFRRAKSQLSLSEEALAEAEPVLAVAVGLGIPGRHFA